ncbi:hypothetical protein L873DRAFT_1799448 [Choiromyces venosus 120613-1]|uniref:Uncharacterized protein n=1 Tax=Choiromyces venosus 120613-1 TaxID=1336337 RepID=A0A3N4K1N8_9PEZI|nr:hypothetical protein L873DRAFT_1799448 [Choiromyces venosus 120613-1]
MIVATPTLQSYRTSTPPSPTVHTNHPERIEHNTAPCPRRPNQTSIHHRPYKSTDPYSPTHPLTHKVLLENKNPSKA